MKLQYVESGRRRWSMVSRVITRSLSLLCAPRQTVVARESFSIWQFLSYCVKFSQEDEEEAEENVRGKFIVEAEKDSLLNRPPPDSLHISIGERVNSCTDFEWKRITCEFALNAGSYFVRLLCRTRLGSHYLVQRFDSFQSNWRLVQSLSGQCADKLVKSRSHFKSNSRQVSAVIR